MAKFKNKKLWKKIGIGAVAGVLGIGAIMGVGALLNKEDETTKIINPTYAIGGLTEQGEYLETKESIYTKDAFECQGLDIDIDFKHNVTYRIFFYDEDNEFLSSTEKLDKNYDESTTPEQSVYARIVITPNEDDEIKWYEVNGYADQLQIEVNIDQVEKDYTDYFATGTHFANQMNTNGTGTQFALSERDGYSTVAIDCTGHKSFRIVYEEGKTSLTTRYDFVGADGLVVTWGQQTKDLNEQILEVPTGAKTLYLVYDNTLPFSVYSV